MKDNQIQVSVFCAAYNHEKYIRQCLEGILQQETNFAFEIIVHDDASTDSTASIIREYETKYPSIIKPIYQEQNQYANKLMMRKFMFPKARGRYVAFCEGDDFWVDPHKLQKQFDALEAHPECAFSMHKVACVNEDGTEKGKFFEPLNCMDHEGILSQEEMAKTIWDRGFIFQMTCRFVRMEILADEFTRPLEEFAKYESGDRNQIRRLILRGPCYYFPEAMTCYRTFSCNSWTSRLRDDTDDDRARFFARTIKSELLYNEFSEYKYDELIRQYLWKKGFPRCFRKAPIVACEAMMDLEINLEDILPKSLKAKELEDCIFENKALVLWGAGDIAQKTWEINKALFEGKNPFNIVAVVDNNSQLWGQPSYVDGLKISAPEKLKQIEFDRIAILNSYEKEVTNQLLDMFGTEDECTKHILNQDIMCWLMAKRYSQPR